MKTILWWGRFDPDYSRNRILRRAFADLGCRLVDFHPWWSAGADWEAWVRRVARPDLVWVPCFRQRDLLAAQRRARQWQVPLVFDPLISAYDKQVFERRKIPEGSAAAARLLAWERRIFAAAGCVVADTAEHARFFQQTLQSPPAHTFVIPVGAEEELFQPAASRSPANQPLHVLFYGSFLGLQGPEVIVAAAQAYQGPSVTWHLLGEGPLRATCEAAAREVGNVHFENWLPYSQLPERIHRADVLLGVFGDSAKAGRVIPNKVYQALACGKPLITRRAAAYPAELPTGDNAGIAWVPPANPTALAQAVARWAAHPEQLPALGQAARRTYEQHFSAIAVRAALARLLAEP
jgi:glycosyltransferase involved in cell wall biosynthesis